MKYEELIKALRYCGKKYFTGDECKNCSLFGTGPLCSDKLKLDAAAAIEALQAELNFYKKRLKEWCGVCPDADCSNCEILGHGHWIPQVTEDGGHNDLLDCSLCGESIWNTQKNKKFCPNCGAKMQEVQDGKD